MLPCLIFEDEHLLVINKPAGLNTHAPGPYAGEGLYDWLRHREPRWESLAIVHRLDKETSGVIVFPKTPLASRSLTGQFTNRTVRKTYLLLTDRPVPRKAFSVTTSIARAGEKYVSRPPHAGGELAETRFRPPSAGELGRFSAGPDFSQSHRQPADAEWLVAEPLTGRTHQIRVHAAERGFPILGDVLYGGTPGPRVCLHAASLVLRHPSSDEEMVFCAPVQFEADARMQLRTALIDLEETNAYRLIHGASDGWPGWYVDRLGDYLLSQGEQPLDSRQSSKLQGLATALKTRGGYHKTLNRQVRRTRLPEASPQLVLGEPAPERFSIRENELLFEVSFAEGYSFGLFLDQRENRRRLLTGSQPGRNIGYSGSTGGAPAILNTFAYTCGFSVSAAKGGCHTVSLDLSRKYLEWGKRNFALNGVELSGQGFIYGDTFDWLRRMARKGRSFDVILLDPPTFSQSKESGVFQARKHYGRLVAAALPLVRPDGVLFASTNTADWEPAEFLASVEEPIRAAGRGVTRQQFVPQPPDFPVSRAEPAYLKTVWLQLGKTTS